jgi:hypothetical protein
MLVKRELLCYVISCCVITAYSVHLVGFKEFTDMADALEASAALVESKMSKDLKKALKKFVTDESEQLGVADAKLGSMIKVCFFVPFFAYYLY